MTMKILLLLSALLCGEHVHAVDNPPPPGSGGGGEPSWISILLLRYYWRFRKIFSLMTPVCIFTFFFLARDVEVPDEVISGLVDLFVSSDIQPDPHDINATLGPIDFRLWNIQEEEVEVEEEDESEEEEEEEDESEDEEEGMET